KRPANAWYKVKKFDTETVVIVDWKMAKAGKFDGMIGAIGFRRLDDPVGSYWGYCSGMNDADRRHMTMHAPELMGRHIEIAYWGTVGDGSPRFPQFKGFRPD